MIGDLPWPVSRLNRDRGILHDGGTTLTLDKAAGEAVLQRKLLF